MFSIIFPILWFPESSRRKFGCPDSAARRRNSVTVATPNTDAQHRATPCTRRAPPPPTTRSSIHKFNRELRRNKQDTHTCTNPILRLRLRRYSSLRSCSIRSCAVREAQCFNWFISKKLIIIFVYHILYIIFRFGHIRWRSKVQFLIIFWCFCNKEDFPLSGLCVL